MDTAQAPVRELSPTGFEGETLADLLLMGKAPNYRDWICSLIRPHLGQRILEVGGGIGNFTERLLDRELVVMIDVDEACLEHARSRFARWVNLRIVRRDIADPAVLELRHHRFDTVVGMNVLEHIEDERRALHHISELLSDGGRFVLMVPMFRWAFGTIDQAIGHVRRYSRRDLMAKLESVGFRLCSARYVNSVGLLGWYVNGRVVRRRRQSALQIRIFDRFVVPWLRRAEAVLKPAFGQSLIAVVEKPVGGAR